MMSVEVPKGPRRVNSDRYPRPPLGWVQAEWVYRDLAARATAIRARPEVARLALAVALTRVSGARHGELAGTLLDDLDIVTGLYRRREHPQGRTTGGVVISHHRLDDTDRLVLDAWLRERGRLVARLSGGLVAHLFTTVHHTHSRGMVVRAGVPIQRNGLEIAWARHARLMNAECAGRPGWEPLPTRYEPLRRAWTVLGG